LDEPTTGVDPVSRKEFWDMLKRLQQKGITMLVSTPYMDEAALCDRVALIQDGSILEIDTPKNVVKKYPKELYNIKASNMYQLLEKLAQYEFTHSAYPFGEYVHYTDTRSEFDYQELYNYLNVHYLDNIFIEKTEPTIEDVFMDLAK
jgi:ABC-type multidrug transport system ATPase subunit